MLGNLNTPRTGHTALALDNGLILLVGGEDENGDPVTDAEVFDPAHPDTLTKVEVPNLPQAGRGKPDMRQQFLTRIPHPNAAEPEYVFFCFGETTYLYQAGVDKTPGRFLLLEQAPAGQEGQAILAGHALRFAEVTNPDSVPARFTWAPWLNPASGRSLPASYAWFPDGSVLLGGATTPSPAGDVQRLGYFLHQPAPAPNQQQAHPGPDQR